MYNIYHSVPRFVPENFAPSIWGTPSQKAEFVNWILRFISEGCPKERFYKTKYNKLCQMFGFIAEYDRNGFYERWCSTPENRIDFVRHILEAPLYPHSPKVDVEEAIQRSIYDALQRVWC